MFVCVCMSKKDNNIRINILECILYMYDFCYITFAALELSNAFLQQPCRLDRSHRKQMVGCSIPSREDLSLIVGFCTLKNPTARWQ